MDEWNAIPELGDHSQRYKKVDEAVTLAPDSLLERARADMRAASGLTEAMDDDDANGGGDGGDDDGEEEKRKSRQPRGDTGSGDVDINRVGSARKQVLSLKLGDTEASSDGNKTRVDANGYMTSLTPAVAGQAEYGDIKKARVLLKSATSSNPGHAPSWIALARLEEAAGRLEKARRAIEKGLDRCTTRTEELWLEGARLYGRNAAGRAFLARAATALPTSVPVWLEIAKAERTDASRRAVLRRALELQPHSVALWRAAIDAEDTPAAARLLLGRAVECVPTEVDFWLALARLENHANARRVLNDARKRMPHEERIWFAALMLEEQHGNVEALPKLAARAVRSLREHDTRLDRDDVVPKLADIERGRGRPATAAAMMTALLDADDDVNAVTDLDTSNLPPALLRAAYAWLIGRRGSLADYTAAADLEHAVGERAAERALLEAATSAHPTAVPLWLRLANVVAELASIEDARRVLEAAFASNANASAIYLAAARFEQRAGEAERARVLLRHALDVAPSVALYEAAAAAHEQPARGDILEAAVKAYPTNEQLWLLHGDIERGLRACPRSVTLWLRRVSEPGLSVARRRALLEAARSACGDDDRVYEASIDHELRANERKAAESLLARAIEALPSSGRLQALRIKLAPKASAKQAATDAVRRLPKSPEVLEAVAIVFEREGKTEKAASWRERARRLRAEATAIEAAR